MVSAGSPHLVILGASGFVGRHLLSVAPFPLPVKAVTRKPPSGVAAGPVTWHAADLLDPAALGPLLGPGDIVCNLAYSNSTSRSDNVALLDNVISACAQAGVARLIHCSTALVAGAVRQHRVLESAACEPRTDYEQTKWLLEQRVLESVARGLDATILRPTAVVGPGGLNLLKLARSLQTGGSFANYLRASLFGRRAMHIVPVQNVVAAVLHVAQLQGPLQGAIFHVSCDDDPANNFRSIEAALAGALGLPARRLPVLPLPPSVLSMLLRLRGQSNGDTSRVYDPRKLLDTGFVRPVSVARAVQEFGESLRQ
jgi:nucleoside-diphosphate-sugar epimerase